MLSVPASIYLGIAKEPLTGAAFCIGYFYHLICDPDLDEMSATSAEGRMVKIPILGWVMYGMSSVYGAIFRRHHRSFITHFPGVSTVIRILFFYFWIPILYYTGVIKWQEWQGVFILWFWIGLSCADFLHWAADMLVKDANTINRNLNWRNDRKEQRR